MKVKELIEKLKEMNPEFEVEIAYTNRSYSYNSSDSEEEKTIVGVRMDAYGTCVEIFDSSRKNN